MNVELKKKPRNHAFDLLCGICIIRMILLHITNMCGLGDNAVWTEVMHWSFYFMSFFFFKAGYFNKTLEGGSWFFIKKKAKQLLVPYFVWGGIGCLVWFFFVWIILPKNNSMVKDMSISHLWTTSEFWGNAPTWFLLSFFSAYVLMHFMRKCPSLRVKVGAKRIVHIKLHYLTLLFPLVSYWLYKEGNPLWFSLNNVFWGLFLFTLGKIWRLLIARFRRSRIFILSCIMVVAFCVLNYIDRGEYTMSSNTWTGSFPITFIKIVCSICGLSGVLLTLRTPRIPILCYIGQHSMVFFVLHYPVLVLYKMIRASNTHTMKGYWDDWIILIILTFAFCSWLVPYVERVSWLSGRKKPKSIAPKGEEVNDNQKK